MNYPEIPDGCLCFRISGDPFVNPSLPGYVLPDFVRIHPHHVFDDRRSIRASPPTMRPLKYSASYKMWCDYSQ
jgi:hypothetical protein